MDGPNVYGLTKRFSEEICRYFAREYDMSMPLCASPDRARAPSFSSSIAIHPAAPGAHRYI